MFQRCSKLRILDLSNFDTSIVTNMNKMFSGCSLLTSLDLSSFNTSQVKNMAYMFNGCSSLTSLNLSNFDNSKITDMSFMLKDCSNLEYINLKNIDESKLNNDENIFSYLAKNAVICIDKDKFEQSISRGINTDSSCYVIDCTDDWILKQKKLIYNTNQCIDSCDNSSQYPYENNGKCYDYCINGYAYDENNNTTNECKCELEQCLLCSNIALKKNLCTKCNINYYPKENDPLNIGEYINCYKEPEGYYLDNDIYRQCYYTCKTCNISGNNNNHNCIKCNSNFPTAIESNNYLNCYENCSYYHFFDDENNYHCTLNLSCPNEYPELIKDKMECIKDEILDLLSYEGNEEIENYNILLKTIENRLIQN